MPSPVDPVKKLLNYYSLPEILVCLTNILDEVNDERHAELISDGLTSLTGLVGFQCPNQLKGALLTTLYQYLEGTDLYVSPEIFLIILARIIEVDGEGSGGLKTAELLRYIAKPVSPYTFNGFHGSWHPFPDQRQGISPTGIHLGSYRAAWEVGAICGESIPGIPVTTYDFREIPEILGLPSNYQGNTTAKLWNIYPVEVSFTKALGSLENPVSDDLQAYIDFSVSAIEDCVDAKNEDPYYPTLITLKQLSEAGYDGIIYTNDSEDPGSVAVVAYDVDQLTQTGEPDLHLEDTPFLRPKYKEGWVIEDLMSEMGKDPISVVYDIDKNAIEIGVPERRNPRHSINRFRMYLKVEAIEDDFGSISPSGESVRITALYHLRNILTGDTYLFDSRVGWRLGSEHWVSAEIDEGYIFNPQPIKPTDDERQSLIRKRGYLRRLNPRSTGPDERLQGLLREVQAHPEKNNLRLLVSEARRQGQLVLLLTKNQRTYQRGLPKEISTHILLYRRPPIELVEQVVQLLSDDHGLTSKIAIPLIENEYSVLNHPSWQYEGTCFVHTLDILDIELVNVDDLSPGEGLESHSATAALAVFGLNVYGRPNRSRNPDESIRNLERRATQGDIDARDQLIAAYERIQNWEGVFNWLPKINPILHQTGSHELRCGCVANSGDAPLVTIAEIDVPQGYGLVGKCRQHGELYALLVDINSIVEAFDAEKTFLLVFNLGAELAGYHILDLEGSTQYSCTGVTISPIHASDLEVLPEQPGRYAERAGWLQLRLWFPPEMVHSISAFVTPINEFGTGQVIAQIDPNELDWWIFTRGYSSRD